MGENTVAPGPVSRNRTGDEPDKPGPSSTMDHAEGTPAEQPDRSGPADKAAGRPEPAGADRAGGEQAGQAGVAGRAARKQAEESGSREPAGTARLGGQPKERGLTDAPGTGKPAVEMPAGLDRTPTEPIPAGGDLASQRRDHGKPAGAPGGRGPAPNGTQDTTVFDEATASGFRERWRELQADFVDDPSRAVRNADGLVDEIMRELVKRKDGLEERWRDGPGDTEKLRIAMTEYRSFFNQLLNA